MSGLFLCPKIKYLIPSLKYPIFYQIFEELSKVAQAQAIMPDDIIYIDEYLERRFQKVCGCKNEIRITVGEFVDTHPQGTYLITMRGHITCAINGCIYDTFDPSDRFVWGAYKV